MPAVRAGGAIRLPRFDFESAAATEQGLRGGRSGTARSSRRAEVPTGQLSGGVVVPASEGDGYHSRPGAASNGTRGQANSPAYVSDR